jgi:hypothetical protein
MNQEEVEQGFASAGWELDGSIYKHLIIGYVENLSIIAYRQTWETQDPSSSYVTMRMTSVAG